jgi:quercetin dioxygenase-like cupin family protein
MGIAGGTGVREIDLPWVDIGVRPGYKQRYQGFFDKARGIGARIGSLYADPYYHSPRHRHTFQQVRFLVGGKMKYGREVYEAGDCLYIPEGAYYGPIKPVPVEDGGSEQMHFIDIQFEGPSGIPYPDPDEVVTAQRALAKTGKFEEGVYTFPDGRNRDAYEAILEKVTGQPVVYPQPRLTSYVVMRSSAYPWIAHRALPGVSAKHLGYFFETGPNIKLVSIAAGAAIPAGSPAGHRAVFLTEGTASFDGHDFQTTSYFMLPSGERHGAISAKDDVKLMMVGWSKSEPVPFELF